jgi:hypothetical protein
MKIYEAAIYFNDLLNRTSDKKEKKVYKKCTDLYSTLENRNLSEKQLTLIEEKIDDFNLNTSAKDGLKIYKAQLNDLKKFLKDEFSLIPKGHYTALGIATGAAWGSLLGLFPEFWEFVFGIVIDFERSLGISFGIVIGVLIGMAAGKYMDFVAEKQHRVLK